jgi:hypothetical protein
LAEPIANGERLRLASALSVGTGVWISTLLYTVFVRLFFCQRQRRNRPPSVGLYIGGSVGSGGEDLAGVRIQARIYADP